VQPSAQFCVEASQLTGPPLESIALLLASFDVVLLSATTVVALVLVLVLVLEVSSLVPLVSAATLGPQPASSTIDIMRRTIDIVAPTSAESK
jgi:hypothetical protein